MAVNSTGHDIGYIEEDRVTLALTLTGVAGVKVGGREIFVRSGDASIIAPSERSSKLVPDNSSTRYRSFAVIAPPGRLPSFRKEGSVKVQSNTPELHQLRRLLNLAFDIAAEPRNSTELMVSSLEALIDDLVQVVLELEQSKVSGSARPSGNDSLARKAHEYMREHFGERLSVSEIAASINVKPRTLQAAFKSSFGRTPWQVLHDIRLEEMRKALVKPTAATSVTSATLDAGLFHLGRSSKTYFDRYGELPSETLRRMAGRTAELA